MNYILLYFIVLPVSLVIDFMWLRAMGGYYREQLGSLMLQQVNLLPAALFYFLFAAALVFFVLVPALEKQSLMYAIGAGAFLGLTAYATYDLVNLSTIVGWPLKMSIIDMVWGATMAALSSGIAYMIALRILG